MSTAPTAAVPSREHALLLLRQMLLIRHFEEKSAELYMQQKIRGFLHLYIGQEAVAVGVMQALEPADSVVATYREHGHALAVSAGVGRFVVDRRVDQLDERLEQFLELVDEHPVGERDRRLRDRHVVTPCDLACKFE